MLETSLGIWAVSIVMWSLSVLALWLALRNAQQVYRSVLRTNLAQVMLKLLTVLEYGIPTIVKVGKTEFMMIPLSKYEVDLKHKEADDNEH